MTTARYAHLSADPIRAANEAVGARIAAAMGNQIELVPARSPASSVPFSDDTMHPIGSKKTVVDPLPKTVLKDRISEVPVQIPRLPVLDTTGRPDPEYFRLWERIREDLQR